MATAAILAVAAAFFYGFARGGKHFAAPYPLRGLAAVGAVNLVVVLFYKLVKGLCTARAAVL